MEVKVYTQSLSAPTVDRTEILRYAMCRENSREVERLLDECLCEIEGRLKYSVCLTRLPVSALGDEVDLSFTRVSSRLLSKYLCDCDEIFLFCATVGVEMDRLIAKYATVSPSRSTMLQAIGSERVEALCDELCSLLEEQIRKEGRGTKPRISPGYGDLPLALQRDIFSLMNPEKNIGVMLSDSLMMIPSKSVTAIVGIKKTI